MVLIPAPHRSYTHAWCSCLPRSPRHPSGSACQASVAALPARGYPTNTHAHIGLCLLRQHLCDPLPPHFQSTSSFVCADTSRRQVAGLLADGLSLSFLPSSYLLPRIFPAHLHLQWSHDTCRNTSLPAPGMALPVTIKQALAFRCCSSNPSFIATL